MSTSTCTHIHTYNTASAAKRRLAIRYSRHNTITGRFTYAKTLLRTTQCASEISRLTFAQCPRSTLLHMEYNHLLAKRELYELGGGGGGVELVLVKVHACCTVHRHRDPPAVSNCWQSRERRRLRRPPQRCAARSDGRHSRRQ